VFEPAGKSAAASAVDIRNILTLEPLDEQKYSELSVTESATQLRVEEWMEQVIRAVCRVTVSGTCGSGTVVGDWQGKKLVLTNAHVAGTQKGRIVDLQRWNIDGSSETGKARIIAAGYANGLSVDFALLECQVGFAEGVTPIPLADRYPDQASGVITYGCPRCEWPSMQVLKLTDSEGQVLKWFPAAIGGRSGSSLIDFTEVGPRVVGLLTWGNGREGLGQSTPFLINAIRGRVQTGFEMLPPDAVEMAAVEIPEEYKQCEIMPWFDGFPSQYQSAVRHIAMMQSIESFEEADQSILDSILEPKPAPKPPVDEDKPDAGEGSGNGDAEESREGSFIDLMRGILRFVRGSLVVVFALLAGILIGAFGRSFLQRLPFVGTWF
jgi:hypothetical protein